jgi:hypothetical protein
MNDEPEPQTVTAFVEIAVSASHKYIYGYVLNARGKIVEFELCQQGRLLEDWLIEDVPPDGCTGLMVWEGACKNAPNFYHGADFEPSFTGEWRKPTAQELAALVPETLPD